MPEKVFAMPSNETDIEKRYPILFTGICKLPGKHMSWTWALEQEIWVHTVLYRLVETPAPFKSPQFYVVGKELEEVHSV